VTRWSSACENSFSPMDADSTERVSADYARALMLAMHRVVNDNASGLSFETLYRMAYRLVLWRKVHVLQRVLKYALRALVAKCPNATTKQRAVVMMRDITMFHQRTSCVARKDHSIEALLDVEVARRKTWAAGVIGRFQKDWLKKHFAPDGAFVRRSAKAWGALLGKRTRSE
jgi:hypothetical protein